MPKINKAFVKSATKLGYHYDSELKGFAMRVHKTRKTFVVRSRLKGSKKVVLFTIGTYPTFTPDEARKEARLILNKLRRGINPNDEIREKQSKKNAASSSLLLK